MRIEGLRAVERDGARRIEADVGFEDGRDLRTVVHYEARGPLAGAIEALPEAFVLAARPAALLAGERRLRVEGPLDPTFARGIEQAMALFSSWYDRCRPAMLEPTEEPRPLAPAKARHTAALFSGGVDAMAMLRENRRAFPLDHPRSIRSAVYLEGAIVQDHVDAPSRPLHVAAEDRQGRRLEAFAPRVSLQLTRIKTNAPVLYPDPWGYMDAGFAAAELAPLVAAGRAVTDALIASSGWGLAYQPHGSHPALDPLFSTSAVDVRLAQPLVNRFDKVGMIADWPPAWDSVYPCHDYLDLPEDQVNCGACEKCVRTMTALVAWGALDRFTVFPYRDVTPEMIERLRIPAFIRTWEAPALLAALKAVGRGDLVRAILTNLRRNTEGWWGKRRRKLARSVRKRWRRLTGTTAAA
jgi:hypothetical protein